MFRRVQVPTVCTTMLGDGVSGIGDEDDKDNLAQKIMGKAKSIVSDTVTNIDGDNKDFLRTKSRVMKNKFSRITARMDTTELLTKFPAFTVVLCLVVTGFFSIESGIIDCRDGFCPFPDKEPSMNVNGDLEVYLPQGSPISALLADVELDWTTNVMVIYVESENGNVTAVDDPKTPEVNDGVLKQIDKVENKINPNRDDGGVDNVIYVLSISTVVKEVNSSAGRVAISFGSAISEAIGDDTISEMINESVNENPDLVGNYAIPNEQDRVDRILREMPENALDKLVRDVGKDSDGDGIKEAVKAGYWNRAVIIIGISDELKNESGTTLSISQLIEQTQNDINQIAEDNDWESKNLTMTLTGPVPITNAVTEESFNLFWTVFPVGVILVAFGLFLFHCDLLQTGRIRFVQGIKVVIISGLPTLCSVWITMGIIGWTDYEVTMTVIIVGPIILALGVSYGLHITNRYAEAKGTPQEKMKIALSSTGRAVLLSAVTTVIGFISLVTTPMAPIQTVGYSLAMGIVVVYIMTMVMVPNLTMLLDLKKPSHPPP